jgi:hypothetical protein
MLKRIPTFILLLFVPTNLTLAANPVSPSSTKQTTAPANQAALPQATEAKCDKGGVLHNKFNEAIARQGKGGNTLDEVHTAMFLESTMTTMTVVERRQALAQIDKNHDKRMSLDEFYDFYFKGQKCL